MAKTNKDQILDYYQKELQYLRRSGAAFAKQYPKIAKRLEISATDAADPHVERLLESFAYLTAKIQKDVDDQFPQVAHALLQSIYPQFQNPIPPSTVMCFDMKEFRGALTESSTIPSGTQLFSSAHDDTECFFQTRYPVELWPIDIASVDLLRRENTLLKQHEMPKQRVLKIRIATLGTPLKELHMKRVRFYIDAERVVQDRLFELLLKESAPVVIETQKDDETVVRTVLPTGSVKPVGFSDDEGVFPFPLHGHHAYRLLFEYFHFPQKFYFFDIENLNTRDAETFLDIYIGLPDNVLFDVKNLDANVLKLGCTPAVNLFSKTSEPILFDHKSSEYRLVADVRREKTTEIHSIENVYALQEGEPHPLRICPYYSYQHQNITEKSHYYWTARRVHLVNRGYEGLDVYMRFVDEDFHPEQPIYPTVYADVLCTNRHLAEYVSSGTLFQCGVEHPAPRIHNLFKPSPTIYPPQEGQSLWRLISHLSINHLGLSQSPLSLEALKEVLRLYAHTGDDDFVPEIEALVNLDTKSIVRRTRQEAWRGFVHGTQVHITVKESGNSPLFLFMTVLHHFLTAFASINSFSELVAKRDHKDTIWHRWHPEVGGIPLI